RLPGGTATQVVELGNAHRARREWRALFFAFVHFSRGFGRRMGRAYYVRTFIYAVLWCRRHYTGCGGGWARDQGAGCGILRVLLRASATMALRWRKGRAKPREPIRMSVTSSRADLPAKASILGKTAHAWTEASRKVKPMAQGFT